VADKISAAKDFIYDNTIGWFTKKDKNETNQMDKSNVPV
jgi:hypothetical protein